MNKNLKKRYLFDENNRVDKLCASLSCFEQYLYFSLKSYNINYKLFFCEDINIKVSLADYTVRRNNIFEDKDVFFIKSWVQPEDKSTIIEEIIRKNKIAIVSTAFNLLESYIWYDNSLEKMHTSHYMGIIEFDENYYYFVESPLLILKNWQNQFPENKCIFKIEKDKLLYACSKFCEIKEISVNEKNIVYTNKLSKLIQKIIINFDYISTNHKFIGNMALEVLKREISTENRDKIHFFKDQFYSHLVYSRHNILKWCLQEDKDYHKCESFNNTVDILDKTINKWFDLNKLILKNMYTPESDYWNKLFYKIEQIQIQERLFILQLKELENEKNKKYIELL